jgi:quercetin dioxygenase-like cupin family protein
MNPQVNPPATQENHMDIQEFEASLKAGNYDEITPVTKEPGYQLGDHVHPFDACALVTAGQIDIAVNGVMKTYKTGDIFRLPAGTLHTENASQFGVSYLAGRRHLKTA